MTPVYRTQPTTMRYRIRINSKLDDRWSQWFDGMEIVYAEAAGETVITGELPDQAALHGLLAKNSRFKPRSHFC